MELLEYQHRLSFVGIKLDIAIGGIIGDAADLLRRVLFIDAPGLAGTAVSIEIVNLDKPVFS